MQIPRSQGRISSEPTLQQHTPITGLSRIGSTIGGAIQARDEKLQEQEVQAKKLELYHNQIDEQQAKLKLDEVLTTEMLDQATTVKQGVSNGEYGANQGREALNKWSDERFKALENDLPDHARQNLQNYWKQTVSQQTTGFLPLQLRADTQKSVVLVDKAFDIATRYDRVQGKEYLKTYLDNSLLSEADKAERVQKYENTRDVMEIDGRISSGIHSNDVEQLKALITDLDNGTYGYIDGPTVQQKKNQTLSRIDALNQKAEAEENKRVAKSGKVFSEFVSQVLTGRELDSEYISNVGTAVQGTEHEAEFNFYKAQSANFQSFSRKSTSEQLTLINQQKAQMKNSSTSDAVNEQKVLSVYEKLHSEKLKTAKDNPNQLVLEKGLEVHPLTGAVLKSDPKAFAANAIENGIGQLSLKDANITVRPISSEDLPEAKQAFEAMGVNEKLAFIGDLQQQAKGVKNGAQLWGAVLGQLGGGDQNYIAAAVAKANGFKSTQNRELATSIINGNQLLKNKQMIMPKENLLREEFNAYTGNTVSGTSANRAFEVFKAVYADTMSARNLQHDKADASPEEDVLKFALESSTGGVYSQSGSFSNYGGGQLKDWKVSKPYGWTDDRFEAYINKGYQDVSKHTGIAVSDLQTLRLQQSGIRSQNNEIQYELLNERGNPLVIDGVQWRVVLPGVRK